MFEWLIQHTAESAALAVVVALLCRGLRHRPAARHALWLLVLLKFLTPPLVRWPWSLPAFDPFAGAAVASHDAPASPREVASAPAEGNAPGEAFPPPEEVVFTVPRTAEPPAVPPSTGQAEPDWWSWLPAVAAWAWAVGGGLVALVELVRIVQLGRGLSRGKPPPAWLEALAAEAAGALGMRAPRVLVLPGASSPMVCALGATRLLWPEGLEERLPPAGRRAVMIHELAHVRRRDHWVGWLLLAGACVWWWHPLFWWVRRRLTLDAELACDAWVVAAMPEARRAYAEALLEVSQRPSAAAAPVLGAASGRRELERRLVMVLRERAPTRLSWRALVGVGMLGLLALPTWSLGGGDPPKPPPAGGEPPAVSPPPGPVVNERNFDVAASDERDKKIAELEAQVKQLMKELEDLHTGKPAAPGDVRLPLVGLPTPASVAVDVGLPVIKGKPDAPTPGTTAPSDEVTLSRVTYKLPAGHAEATAAFLREHVGASVLETKAEGDNLVVTTTPETQKTIKMLVTLIQSKPPVAPPSRDTATPSLDSFIPPSPSAPGGISVPNGPAPVPPGGGVAPPAALPGVPPLPAPRPPSSGAAPSPSGGAPAEDAAAPGSP